MEDLRRLRMKEVDVIAGEVAKRVAETIRASVPTCVQCSHWHEKDELCGLWLARPPAKVIAFGCEKYEHMPF